MPIVRGPDPSQHPASRTTLFAKYYYGHLVLRRVLWVILGGPIVSLLYLVGGVLLCLTIVGLPFGLQAFGMAWFTLDPIGKQAPYALYAVPDRFNRMALKMYGNFTPGMIFVLNLLWQLLLVGWLLFFLHLLLALINAVTVVGLGNAYQHLMLSVVALSPFGRQVVQDPAFPLPGRRNVGRSTSSSRRRRGAGTGVGGRTTGTRASGANVVTTTMLASAIEQQQPQPQAQPMPQQPFGAPPPEAEGDSVDEYRFPGTGHRLGSLS